MGIDLSDIFAFYSLLKDQVRSLIPSLIGAVRVLQERDIDFSSLSQEAQNVETIMVQVKADIES